ncbi:MAG: InlB B-repeat-containing protein [Lachnospiraceae bacterium]|nr:InlB B-repeat-containing protein [Lachnospiraceae bacterium]
MRQLIVGVVCVLMILWTNSLVTEAKTMQGAEITMSPDGKAFTTCEGDTSTSWYENDYEISTGVKSTIKEPGTGEHGYVRTRRDEVPISLWRVVWKTGRCIHSVYPEGNQYHGVVFGKNPCYSSYYSGWFPCCADCGEMIDYCCFYMSDKVAATIKKLDLSKAYYYRCPHCNNLEQAADLPTHNCKGVSANRYFVRYHANFGSGFMEKSTHMVNNATEYEGCAVTPQTKLNLNTFVRNGYEFAGWNTKKDGSGKSYADGATIYNLCMEENSSITLYAQWRKKASYLEIDPNGGRYQGKEGIQKITGYFQSEYEVDTDLLSAPMGSVVHFDTCGGEYLADMRGKNVFDSWSYLQPFHGKMQNGIYQFLGEAGTTDRIIANYKQEAIILPVAEKEGYSFGGWYEDMEGLIPIGQGGDRFQPDEDITLYAKWVELQLLSKDNYLVNQGKGAVDLSWNQEDKQNKVYEIFQKKENELWTKLSSIENSAGDSKVSKTIFYSGEEGSYTVPESGFYTLELTGAQGGNYGIYKGGKGGSVEGTLFLQKGEKLEYILGGQNGYNGGGSSHIYGNGGGYSIVSTKRLGTIMIAGGGGGASEAENGGLGGSTEKVVEGMDGTNGEAGGGGGYRGGSSGSVDIHYHIEECEHLHIGTPTTYGGCYTKLVRCGSRDIEFKVTNSVFSYGNIADDGGVKICKICNSYECMGHLTEYGSYFCRRCGNEEKYPISICSAMTGYALNCDEKYRCGLEDGQVLMVQTSGGGTNYVNGKICINHAQKSGIHLGDGNLIIQSKQLGVWETMEQKGVKATDCAAPQAISMESVKKTAVSDEEIRITFARPQDNGTAYYHQVKSYDKNKDGLMCESNITKNILTSQVIGYRYAIDKKSDTIMGANNLFLADTKDSSFLTVSSEDKASYLHIAAQDKAGNIGPTIHINISKEDIVYWPLITEKILLGDSVNIAKSEEENTYYVKADNSTPIQLTLTGMLCGTARKEYQIDEAVFVIHSMDDNIEDGIFTVIIPKRDKVYAGNYTYLSEYLYKRHSGNDSVKDGLYTLAQRYNMCRNISVKQKLILSDQLDGKKIRIMPRVVAIGEKETTYSKEESDLLNSIYLIGDSRGPLIEGAQYLDEFGDVENLQEGYEVKLEAMDTGSGVAQFYVEVRNRDNGMVKYYEDTSLSGKIELFLEPQDPIFMGNFSIVVYAKDRVGNETTIHKGVLEVGIEAEISRILEPHTSVFKCGESGVLDITTWGYVEKVVVSFPDSFSKMDGSLNRTIYYEIPGFIKREKIIFQVPYDIPDEKITVQVTAYKNGEEYKAEPQLLTMEIQGDIRNEIRTRLR